MPKLSPISSSKLIKILLKEGFIQVRQKGSHARLEHLDGGKTGPENGKTPCLNKLKKGII